MSYNRPKFSPCATWNPNAITFSDSNTLIGNPVGIFINTDNTVYATTSSRSSVLVWTEGSSNLTSSIFSDLLYSDGVFVTTSGDVYADNGDTNKRVELWTANTNNSSISMYVRGTCSGLFVDIYDTLYCSIWSIHQVLKKPAGGDANTSFIAAGTGASGSAPDMLHYPNGVFVDIDLNLYVADNGNHRIHLFRSGQLNGTTVAGAGATDTITLDSPTTVVLDADGYLFIVDRGHHRIVGSGPRGFRCIAGCSGLSGATANQLFYPYGLGFDSYGNLYVTDASNNRIQKFLLAKNECGESFRSQLAFPIAV